LIGERMPNLLRRRPHDHRGWFTAVGAAIACLAAAAYLRRWAWSPEEIERSIRAIVTFARSANSPFVTSPR